MKHYNRAKELKENEAEEARARQARPNHNPVLSGLSPEDEALQPTEELEIPHLPEFGRPFSLTELPSLPDNVFYKPPKAK